MWPLCVLRALHINRVYMYGLFKVSLSVWHRARRQTSSSKVNSRSWIYETFILNPLMIIIDHALEKQKLPDIELALRSLQGIWICSHVNAARREPFEGAMCWQRVSNVFAFDYWRFYQLILESLTFLCVGGRVFCMFWWNLWFGINC